MKLKYFKLLIVIAGIAGTSSCKKMLDINQDPDRLLSSSIVYPQLLSGAQVNLGFESGSDLFRYPALIMQQMSGLASEANQTWSISRYNIAGSDLNNVWSSMYASTLSDLELVITQATTAGSPHYAGLAKLLKAYEFSKIVDTWGDVPFTESLKLLANTQPKYDDDAAIYTALLALIDEAITDMNATTSLLSPGINSVIYTNASWATSRALWIKFANTLKLRLLIHYSKVDPAFCVAQITILVNTPGITFMTSNNDNFQMSFYDVPNQQNPISAFEVSRRNYLFADAKMVGMMNAKSDPRRPFYFSDFPVGSGSYVGVPSNPAPGTPSNNYSRIHTYLRGAVKTAATGTNSAVYSGAAPARMLTYAEYCFIRSEAALMGAPGDPQMWFTNGITASMQDAGVAAADITAYLAVNGTLTGSDAQKLQQIIEEKYIANFGVILEPWNDWRRTGYPALAIPSNVINTVSAVPRSLFYPQSEIDLNPNNPGQKPANLQAKVFWDN